jgi:hypothetical protein
VVLVVRHFPALFSKVKPVRPSIAEINEAMAQHHRPSDCDRSGQLS